MTKSSEGDTMMKTGIDWYSNISEIKVKTQNNSRPQNIAGAVLCSNEMGQFQIKLEEKQITCIFTVMV